MTAMTIEQNDAALADSFTFATIVPGDYAAEMPVMLALVAAADVGTEVSAPAVDNPFAGTVGIPDQGWLDYILHGSGQDAPAVDGIRSDMGWDLR